MKIPEKFDPGSAFFGHTNINTVVYNAFLKAAADLGIKYGTFIDVVESREWINGHIEIVELLFKFDDKTFASADELERTLKLRAFL